MDHLLQRIAGELILPPFGPFFLLLLAAMLGRTYRKTRFSLALVATAALLATSLSGLQNHLRAPWPVVPEVVATPYPEAEAIVVLGGGRYLAAPEYGGDTAAASTLERLRYAAKLYRETGKPILVSGGRPGGLGRRTEAEIMREILENEFHVPVAWMEPDSQDTAQNAANSVAILRAAGIRSVYLVTHGSHMERAVSAFAGAGISPVPMITGFIRPDPGSVLSWTPSFQGLAENRAWLYEKLASLKNP